MVIEFRGDAIVLSGETGTKLKCDILEGYYRTWWSITSGGKSKTYGLPTAIIELNAGTGLDYIQDTNETIFGSSGHALRLKMDGENSTALKIVLVEEDSTCFNHLKNVIAQMWPKLDVNQAQGPIEANRTGVYLLTKKLPDVVDLIVTLNLGNSLFFFDPLLFTPWSEIERVAKNRITEYYQTRTEFIVFLFTSDWFKGRRTLGLSPLPTHSSESRWTNVEKDSVLRMDELFGGPEWRNAILGREDDAKRMDRLVQAYRRRLHRWFRYVLPMPFQPKENQLYHLFMCSNYERGIGITKGFYIKYTGNAVPEYDDQSCFSKFKKLHTDVVRQLSGNQRPLSWKLLWTTIRNHDEGLCDIRCQDFREKEPDLRAILGALEWLELNGYLLRVPQLSTAWPNPPPMYMLDWKTVRERLGIGPPPELVPVRPKSLR